jgi:glycerophosphoryl diester phosphodiesterase
MKPWPYPRWIAHRGAGVLAPENTLAAFQLGARHGYQMFECDAKLSADGVPFLLHDATLERTTNGSGAAGELDWDTLSQLDAGSWHSETYRGEPLCTLQNLGRWLIGRGLMLNIEIKPTPGTERLTGERVARAAAELFASARRLPLLTSFQPESLMGAARMAPHLPRGLLLHHWRDDVFDHLDEHGHQALIAHHSQWTPERCDQAALRGFWRLSYTVNEPELAQTLWRWGHEAIITDAVDVFHPLR